MLDASGAADQRCKRTVVAVWIDPVALRTGQSGSRCEPDALASVEADPERVAFLRDFDVKRLPDSSSYTTDLDPAEITLEAAEMCAEQKDWPRVLVALDKYAKVGKPNSLSDALRAQAEKRQSPEAN